MGFDTRRFLDDLLDIIDENEGEDCRDTVEILTTYILEQADYARQCGVID